MRPVLSCATLLALSACAVPEAGGPLRYSFRVAPVIVASCLRPELAGVRPFNTALPTTLPVGESESAPQGIDLSRADLGTPLYDIHLSPVPSGSAAAVYLHGYPAQIAPQLGAAMARCGGDSAPS